MRAFIELHGVYLGFWLLMMAVSLPLLYFVVKWAIVAAYLETVTMQ